MRERSSIAAKGCSKLLARSSVLAAGLPPNSWVPPAFLFILGSPIVPLDVCGALGDSCSSGWSLLGPPELSGVISVSFWLSRVLPGFQCPSGLAASPRSVTQRNNS